MLWLKAFHIVAVICWFASIFYLPRLFVYHAMAEDEISKERFKIMERKLYRGIGTPSMVATFILGGLMVYLNHSYYFSSTWFWLKMVLVVLVAIYHEICGKFLKEFAQDKVTKSHVFFRWFNEAPVVLLIAIVILVTVKQPI